jgi:enhancing lycopene biosynthesis protein 2
MSIHNIDDCDMIVVVGGFTIAQALVENDSNGQDVEVPSLLASTFVSSQASNSTSWITCSYSESLSPPSAEKYVLNATLLI